MSKKFLSGFYQLELSQFRGINHLDIKLASKGIVLLEGRSGTGKTTILEALSFVFYDGAKNSCYPRNERNNKKKPPPTWVRLTFPAEQALEIYRQRRPNLLTVTGPNLNLVDDVAQAYLNDLIGPVDQWLVGGYLKFNKKCAFLSMTSQEKLKFLQELSLPGNFTQIMDKIHKKIIEINSTLAEVNTQLQVYTNLYNKLTTNYAPVSEEWKREEIELLFYNWGVNNFYELKDKITNYYKEEIKKLNNEIMIDQIELTKYQENLKRRESYQKNLEELENKLSSFSSQTDQLKKYQLELEILSEQITLQQKSEQKTKLANLRADLEEKLAKVPNISPRFNLADLLNYQKILEGPSLEELNFKLANYQQSLHYLKILIDVVDRKKLSDNFDNLNLLLEQYPKTSSSAQIEELSQKIYSLELHSKKMVCPTCKEGLWINGNKLELCPTLDNSAKSKEECLADRKKLMDQEAKFQQRKNLEEKIKELNAKLNSWPQQVLPEIKPDGFEAAFKANPDPIRFAHQLEIWINQTSQSLVLREKTPNINIQEEKKIIENWNLRRQWSSELEKIIAAFNAISESQLLPVGPAMELLEKERINLRQKIAKCQEEDKNRQICQAKIDQIKSQIASVCLDKEKGEQLAELLPGKINSQKEMEENLLKTLSDIDNQIKVEEINQVIQTYHEYYNYSEKIRDYLTKLTKIKATIITAEYVLLDNVLDQVNGVLNEILTKIFVEPITVMIRSLRQLKTSDQIKPEINLEINYKGSQFTNVNELSGGEKKRVSIALVIAFSKMGKSPILLLDESLANLNSLDKELAMNTIQNYFMDKLTILVNHDSTEGNYDKIIQMEDIL